jgi:hypothetical protein
MVFGLITNLIGSAVMAVLIVCARRYITECSLTAPQITAI